jgi:SAM-dependent methyltransferase
MEWMNRKSNKAVASYYDSNTRRFLTFGHGAAGYAIHRAVWGPGVSDRRDAIHFVHGMIAKELEQCSPLVVLDLGCGVGGSMLFLAERFKAEYAGVTISQVQYDIGKSLFAGHNLSSSLQILAGDFVENQCIDELKKINTGRRTFVYCIESFLHVSDADSFFAGISRLLSSGDRLVICDDFLALPDRAAESSEGTDRLLSDFIDGWKVGTLISAGEVEALAMAHRFTMLGNMDLSTYLEIGRPRDKIIKMIIPFIRPLRRTNPFLDNLIGGGALQECLQKGIIQYRYLTFQKK